jgi:Na+-driven multidrug efflux pump
MLQNMIAGMQGIIDHAMVGHFVGYEANAAIGVSWQIIIVVIVFMSSLFTGMAVLVARFAGANDHDKVNRVVYQAFLTAIGMRPSWRQSGTWRRRRCSGWSTPRREVRARRCRSCG